MPTLLVIVGPTGVGKTELALRIAERFGCPIVNADSRQIYREIPIGTAAPTAEEQARAKHYFVGTHSLADDYNAGQYERDAVEVLNSLTPTPSPIGEGRDNKVFAILTGGSMMYIDAVCKGLDDIPEVPQSLREEIRRQYEQKRITWLQTEVERLDPQYWAEVDQQNPQRLLHCLEICLATGRTFTEFRQGKRQERPWRIVKIGLRRERDELYERINRRVTMMMDAGLEEEARAVYGLRHLNSLQTVGYRELFRYIDGEWSREEAINMIRQNSRHYAKRQMTWWNRDKEIHWIDANKIEYENTTFFDWLDGCLAG